MSIPNCGICRPYSACLVTTAGQNDRRKSPENVSEEERGHIGSRPSLERERRRKTPPTQFSSSRRAATAAAAIIRETVVPRRRGRRSNLDTFAIGAWKLSPTEEKEGRFFPFPARFSFRPRHSAASIIRGERRTNGCNFSFMTTVDGAEWSEKSEWGWERKGERVLTHMTSVTYSYVSPQPVT